MEQGVFMFVIGLGYWIQGFRCFPWLAMNFYLIDTLKVHPVTLQVLQNSFNLPMVAKPLYGIVSDAIYIRGAHRLPYVIIGAFLQAISWGAVAFIPAVGSSLSILTVFLLLSNLGASIGEVANDALVAEVGKNMKSNSGGELQSFACMAGAVGALLGNLLGGIALGQLETKSIFVFFGLLVIIQIMTCFTVNEQSFGLVSSYKVKVEDEPDAVQSKKHSFHKKSNENTLLSSVQKQAVQLTGALRQPDIAYSLAWFSISYAIIPLLIGTMFFYQTQYLKLDPQIVGLSKVIGQMGILVGSALYSRFLKNMSLRKLLASMQIFLSLCMLSDIILVKQLNIQVGIPNSVYILGPSSLVEVLGPFKMLPFSVLLAQLCPPSCEGSLMAFAMSVQALAIILSGYLGVMLTSYFQVSPENYSGLPSAILVQAVATLVPLALISFIPREKPTRVKKDE